jgi:hypothetical protein
MVGPCLLGIGKRNIQSRVKNKLTKDNPVARNDTTISDVGQSVAIGDVKVIKEFLHLGSLMTTTNIVSLQIQ